MSLCVNLSQSAREVRIWKIGEAALEYEYRVNQLCTVMHRTANKGIGCPGNSAFFVGEFAFKFNPVVTLNIAP